MITKRLNNKGFSLIEVIVAMVLIGIVGAAFSSVYFTANKASTNNAERLQALFIAQEIIEDLRAERDSLNIRTEHDLIHYFTSPTNPSDEYLQDAITGKMTRMNEHFGKNYEIAVLVNDIFNDDFFIEVRIEVKPENARVVKLATRYYLY